MPVVFLTPSSEQGLLWAQLKTFPTGNQHYNIYVTYICIFEIKQTISTPYTLI